MGLWKTEQREKKSRNGGRDDRIFQKGILQRCAWEDLPLPLLPHTLVPHGHARTRTHTRTPHALPTHLLPALRLSCSLPRTPFPLFSKFKSYRSCKVPHQSSFKISIQSQIFSREPSVFPSCKALSSKFFRPY